MHASMNIIDISTFYCILPYGFKSFFKDENRTIGREIIWVLALILIIAEGNKIINNSLEGLPYTSYSSALGLTVGIGIFPIFVLLPLAIKRTTKERQKHILDVPNQLTRIIHRFNKVQL